ncbi:MAG: hypothetical protein K2X47_02505 [Bdellovibrionales bacterium]|nr:hypothetical protein [Bdellovibrionales bacterium]
MREIRQNLTRLKANEEFQLLEYYYPSSPDADVYDLALALGQFMEKTFQGRRSLSPSDHISLVGYSQGGLVNLLWIQHAYRNHADYFPRYRNWVRNVISLATPFWGTEIAALGALAKGSRIQKIADALPFSQVQLREMSALSHTMFRFRTKATRSDFTELNNQISQSTRFLSVVGRVATQLPKPLAALGLKSLDTDMTVPIPSGNPNLIYAEIENASQVQSIEESDFRKTSPIIPVRIIKAVHAAIPHLNVPAIHERGSDAARIVAEHLVGKIQTHKWESSTGPFHRTQIQITLEIPDAMKVTEKDVDLKYEQKGVLSRFRNRDESKSLTMDPFSLSIFSEGEILSQTTRNYRNLTQFHYTATGTIGAGTNTTAVLTLRVRGQKEKLLKIPVEAGMTSYLNLRF